MTKNLDNRTFIIVGIISFLAFAILDTIKFSVFDGGVDSGYYLSTARDWVKLGRIPNFDTYSIYTPIAVMLYAIPYLMFDSPDIIAFLSINLFIYLLSFMLFLRLAVNLFGTSIMTLVLGLTFLYNTHEVVNDIKLENLVLAFGLLIVNYVSKLITITKADNKNWGFKEAIIIGSLSGFSFLTKQFGGLSLIFSILMVLVLFYKRGFRLGAMIISSFSLVIAIYLLLQILAGLSTEIIFGQLKGEFLLQCEGSVYGGKNIKDIFVGIKYFKFDGFIYLFIIAFVAFARKILDEKQLCLQDIQSFKKLFLFTLVFFFSLLPFYFQVYPHYKFFGVPFVYFTSMLFIKEVISISDSFIVGLVVKLIGLFTLFMSIYSSVQWLQQYKSLELKKKTNLYFERNINSKLKRGILVHCLQDRKLWFKCEFVSPFPETIGYGYLQMNCIEEALNFETPKSFWVIGSADLTRETLPNYIITKRYDFVDGLNKYSAIFFKRDFCNVRGKNEAGVKIQ
jgi:hypothetical protein